MTETADTPFYRLRHSEQLVTRVVTLLAFGCPPQAIVAAFDLDEHTVASWRDRAGEHCQSGQEQTVKVPHDLGQVQVDELRVKQQGRISWMALALMVSTRLWLGGSVSLKPRCDIDYSLKLRRGEEVFQERQLVRDGLAK